MNEIIKYLLFRKGFAIKSMKYKVLKEWNKIVLDKVPTKDKIRGIKIVSKQFETETCTDTMFCDIIKGQTKYTLPLETFSQDHELKVFVKNY